MLKLVTPYCITSLRSIQNFSITASTYPSMWKTSIIVIPTLEKAAWDKIADLRPISLLSILAKPFVKNAINYLKTKKNLMSKLQSGSENTMVRTQQLQRFWMICHAMDNQYLKFLALLDQSKVFDVVNFHLLTVKLHIGCDPVVCLWFRII